MYSGCEGDVDGVEKHPGQLQPVACTNTLQPLPGCTTRMCGQIASHWATARLHRLCPRADLLCCKAVLSSLPQSRLALLQTTVTQRAAPYAQNDSNSPDVSSGSSVSGKAVSMPLALARSKLVSLSLAASTFPLLCSSTTSLHLQPCQAWSCNCPVACVGRTIQNIPLVPSQSQCSLIQRRPFLQDFCCSTRQACTGRQSGTAFSVVSDLASFCKLGGALCFVVLCPY